MLGRHSAVEDATQEALIRAWRKQASCQTPADPVPWMRAIARREALRAVSRPTEVPLDDAPHATTAHAHPSQSIAAIDVSRALANLAPAERSVLELRYWHDLTQIEAARRLQIPAGTARVRLHRGRARLRRHLEGYGEP